MIVKIDKMNPTPIYQQLRNEIVTAIASGELQPGDQLPSVRSLASDLGINLHTVNKAYAILRDEGYVLMRGRAGAVVAEPLRSGEGDVSGVEAATPGSGSFDPGALAPDASIRAALADKRLADGLMLLALEHKASGGSRASFEAAVAQALDAAYRAARPKKIEPPPLGRSAYILFGGFYARNLLHSLARLGALTVRSADRCPRGDGALARQGP